MRILIVDQNKVCKETLALDLNKSQQDFTVFHANDGVDALSMLQENYNIDLIISDLFLPRMDGVSLLKTLRKNQLSIQFIIFSSQPPDKLSHITKSLQLGAWIAKSYSKSMELNTKEIIKKLEIFSDKLMALKEYESINN